MPAYLSPVGNEQQSDANGAPLSGGEIYTYAAGTSTPIATYTSSAGDTPQQNPVELNSSGLPANPIWLPAGQAVKLVIKDANGVTLRTVDNVTGVGDPTNASAVDQWVTFSGTPTYISAASFSVGGDQTGNFQVRRRLKTANTGGVVYSSVSASSYDPGSGLTTVTVANDSGSLDAGLSQVAYGLISPVNTSWPQLSLLNVQKFTAAGSSTYTPTAGTRAVLVEVVGGGGAGGGGAANAASAYSCGAGGGAGGFASSFLTSGFSGVTVTVAAAGAAGAAGASGGAGGTTSFGALLSATGGAGGTAGTSIAVSVAADIQSLPGGNGGAGTGGNIANANGEPGGYGLYMTRPKGGEGGSSKFGGGAKGRYNESANGIAAVSPGSGGGGAGVPASDSAKAGGAGATGMVVVYEFG